MQLTYTISLAAIFALALTACGGSDNQVPDGGTGGEAGSAGEGGAAGSAGEGGDAGGEAFGVHVLWRGREHQRAADAGQQPRILRLLAWIAGQILGRGELGRIDEVGDHHSIGALNGFAHQGQMAVMQGAHGRNQAHRQALSLPVAYRGAQFRDGADDEERSGLGHGEPVNLVP